MVKGDFEREIDGLIDTRVQDALEAVSHKELDPMPKTLEEAHIAISALRDGAIRQEVVGRVWRANAIRYRNQFLESERSY